MILWNTLLIQLVNAMGLKFAGGDEFPSLWISLTSMNYPP